MKLSQYFLPTTKEVPSEAKLASHILMLRAGLIRKVGSGLYSYMPAGLNALRKVEQIIRKEMNKAGALEISMPFLIPQKLLKKTGRWEIFEKELYTLSDHKKNYYALSPTNEENFSELATKELISYKQLPANFYQIKTKFRDEIRPRYGVMRAREFIMKDAYSFHLTDESLDETYEKMRQTYLNAFQIMGLDIVPVKASSGAMGGSDSEEFMVPSDVGEETIISCTHCHYAANVETALVKIEPFFGKSKEIQCIETPNIKTIEKLSQYLDMPAKSFIKTMVYEKKESQYSSDISEKMAVVLLRGDCQLNDAKLEKILPQYRPALAENILTIFECSAGYLSPYKLEKKHPQLRIIADENLRHATGMTAGANKENHHLKGIDIKYFEERFKNFSFEELHLAEKGHLCGICSEKVDSFKGIEVGHIFKLGRRYTKAFQHLLPNEEGIKITPTMGCYGIGVSRCLAAIVEKNHDGQGIIFPLTVAPFSIVLISLGDDEKVLTASEKIYEELNGIGIEILWDDRAIRPGIKFKDQDLLGCPYQIICSQRNMDEKVVELKNRRNNEREMISLDNIVDVVAKICQKKI